MADNATKTGQRKARSVMLGVVTAAGKNPKTIHVSVQYLTRHAKYGKFLRRSAKVHAHDEKGEARIGDRVEVMECRPMSKTKKWRLVKVVTAAPQD